MARKGQPRFYTANQYRHLPIESQNDCIWVFHKDNPNYVRITDCQEADLPMGWEVKKVDYTKPKPAPEPPTESETISALNKQIADLQISKLQISKENDELVRKNKRLLKEIDSVKEENSRKLKRIDELENELLDIKLEQSMNKEVENEHIR
jgi:hypothetical protein